MSDTRAMTDVELDDILSNYRQWLIKVAYEMTRNRSECKEDLAQEGHIAMWRALKKYDPEKGALATWLTNAARMRMLDVLRRDTWTGTDSRRGHVRSGHEPPVDTHDDHWIERLIAESNLDGVELAYHEGEIMRAINALTPTQQRYVIDRFWGDKAPGDLPRGIWQNAKPKLAAALAHLVSV